MVKPIFNLDDVVEFDAIEANGQNTTDYYDREPF